jgi:lipoprotein-anchoring transpeptidase ErfK/SrfK
MAFARHHPAMRRGVWAGSVLVVALAVSSCGGEVVVPQAPLEDPAPPVLPAPIPEVDPAAGLLQLRGTVLAKPLAGSIDVHWKPGTDEPFMDLITTNPWSQPLRLLVTRDALDDDGDLWLRVQLPIWPNGQQGWVAASEVDVSKAKGRIVVDLSKGQLIRHRGGNVVTRLPVAIGKPSTPTPTGRFVVWARVNTGTPSGPYGSYILGLSGFSESIDPANWPGDPRLAIHGTDDPTDAGQAISSGCIRVLNGLLRQIKDVPMGTPVLIRR